MSINFHPFFNKSLYLMKQWNPPCLFHFSLFSFFFLCPIRKSWMKTNCVCTHSSSSPPEQSSSCFESVFFITVKWCPLLLFAAYWLAPCELIVSTEAEIVAGTYWSLFIKPCYHVWPRTQKAVSSLSFLSGNHSDPVGAADCDECGGVGGLRALLCRLHLFHPP